MKKTYTSPALQQERFETADIITTSPKEMNFNSTSTTVTQDKAVQMLNIGDLFNTPQ